MGSVRATPTPPTTSTATTATKKPPNSDAPMVSAPAIAEPLEPPSMADAPKALRIDTLASAAVVAAAVAPDELPPHLRDHLLAVSDGSAHASELLPPLANVTASKRAQPSDSSQPVEIKRVIVCGAGIVGLTTCYYLAKLGHEVLCVEKESSVGTQASLCNGAFLDPAMYSSWADMGNLKRAKASARGDGSVSRTIIEQSAIAAASRAGECTTHTVELPGGRAADAAGHTKRSAATSSGSSSSGSSSSGSSGWRGMGKPMKIEFSALRDPTFWKWGWKFYRNAKNKDKADANSRTIRELGFYSMIKLRELQMSAKKGELDMDETAEGTIEVFRNGAELDHVWDSDRKRHLDELGMELQPMDALAAEHLEPALRPDVYEPGAILSAYGTSGDVHKMCQALYRLCIREGVMFRFNAEVIEILTDKTRVIALQTRRGALIEGDEFVLALGNATAPIARRAGLPLSIYPVKGYVISVPVSHQSKPLTHNVYAGGLALVSPLGRWLRISGGVDFSNPNKAQANQPRFDWLLAQAKTLFPDGYLDTKHMKTHVCWRPVTPDDVPLIGRTRIENLFVNAGHGSKGWTLSFGAAALLADLISDLRPQLEMSKFDPHRT